MRFLSLSLLLVVGNICCGQMISVENAGFEDLTLGNNGFTANIPGWTRFGDSGTYNPSTSNYPGEAPEGNNVAYSANGGPTIGQVLSANLEADLRYTLAVEVGNRLDIAFGGYQIRLLAGGVEIASQTNEINPASGTFETATLYYQSSATDSQLGQPLEIQLRSFGPQTNFDNVRLNAASIPEPSAGMLLVVGLCGLLTGRRRRT